LMKAAGEAGRERTGRRGSAATLSVVPPQLLDDAAVEAALAGLGWSREGKEIVKHVEREDFAGALAYVNEVGRLAEARNHHPDIAISWNKVTLRLSTHSAGGLTRADMDLAAEIDRLGADPDA
jgi:4a-hydroxytetrahydrobiopterin dehydratase